MKESSPKVRSYSLPFATFSLRKFEDTPAGSRLALLIPLSGNAHHSAHFSLVGGRSFHPPRLGNRSACRPAKIKRLVLTRESRMISLLTIV
jgi:hypothetical protein